MFSVNGRKKENKEEASKKKIFKTNLVCNCCDFIEDGRCGVFGEVTKCSNCNSTDVRFEYV